jgi:hypothetical protein
VKRLADKMELEDPLLLPLYFSPVGIILPNSQVHLVFNPFAYTVVRETV